LTATLFFQIKAFLIQSLVHKLVYLICPSIEKKNSLDSKERLTTD
jgi:hypothetical protein